VIVAIVTAAILASIAKNKRDEARALEAGLGQAVPREG
jgi:hypothetical protein